MNKFVKYGLVAVGVLTTAGGIYYYFNRGGNATAVVVDAIADNASPVVETIAVNT